MTAQFDLRQRRYERACWWLAQGVAIVPLKPHSKELQPGYGSQQARLTDIAFARKWFLNTDANLGVVLGAPRSLTVGDWDAPQAYQIWRAGLGTQVKTLIEQTGRGYHAFFISEGLGQGVGPGCEFKTRGVCMVSPSVHPAGAVYRVVNDGPLANLDRENAHLLFPFLSEIPHPRAREGQQLSPVLAEAVVETGGKGVVARIKAARPIVEEMQSAGVKLWRSGQTTLVGLCPFHTDQHPSLWVYPKSGLWGCNRLDCPAAGSHDVINFRAMHGGVSNQAAIKQLADEFLKLS